eukprot:8159931-Pyramimonas_sp.AAC.1
MGREDNRAAVWAAGPRSISVSQRFRDGAKIKRDVEWSDSPSHLIPTLISSPSCSTSVPSSHGSSPSP